MSHFEPKPVIRLRGWIPLFVLPVAVLIFVPDGWPRWGFMWLTAFAIYAGCKWLTWRRAFVTGVPWRIHAGYWIAWPGLDAPAFLKSAVNLTIQPPRLREWFSAVLMTIFGVAVFWNIARLIPSDYDLLVGWCGMLGMILMLHFGTFHLLSCAWRTVGIAAVPLMNRPLWSQSVSEFWGKRWNTAFRDITHRFLFRPLVMSIGTPGALMVGFIISGLIHDLVISVPAGGGYGLPTLYFIIQGCALFVERSRVGRHLGLGCGWRGRLFTFMVLAGPAYWLFHPPFVRNVILPMMRAFGAIT